MKLLTILCVLIFSVNIGTAQFQISGKVTDSNGQYLNFASVFLDGTKFASASDEQGNYVLEGITEDEYQLVVSYLGYKDYESIFYIEKDTVINIVLEGSVFGLETVEIRGTWANDKYPFAKTDYSEKQLTDMNTAVDAPFLLQYAPSVVVSSDAGAGVGYTGIRIRGVDPTRVNVTVNGIPLNDSESQSVYWVNLPDIMNSVKDIQIQRGVGTSTNGAGTFGATINLNTNKVEMHNYARIEGSLGSYNTRKLGIEVGTGLLNDKFTLDGRYSVISSDGYVDRAKSALTSFFISGARISPKQSLRFNVFSGNEITYQSWYGLPVQYKDTDRTFNAAGIDNDFSRVDNPYGNEVDNYKQIHYQLFLQRKIRPNLNMDAAIHYTRGLGFFEQFKSDQSLEDYGLLPAAKANLIRRKWLDNHFFGGVYNIKKNFGSSELIVGGGLHDYIGRHFGEVNSVYDLNVKIPEGYTYYDNNANKLDFNTYAKYQHDFGALSAFVDLQYRLVNYSFVGKNDDGNPLDQNIIHHFFNPKAGLFYTLSNYSNLYASFAVANREPNRGDYTESSPSDRPRPERLYDYEAGMRLGTKSISFGTNLYLMSYKDHLVLTGKLNDVGDYTKVNIPDSYRAGIELDVAANLSGVLDFGASLTISRNKVGAFTEYIDDWDNGSQIAVDHTNTDISFSPDLVAGAEVKWNVIQTFAKESMHKMDVSWRNKYVGKQYLDNTMNEGASLDPFHYSDVILRYGIQKGWFKNASIELHVLNAFNNKYVSNGWVYRYKSEGYDPVPYDPYSISDRDNQYNMIGLFPQATRNFMLRLRLDF